MLTRNAMLFALGAAALLSFAPRSDAQKKHAAEEKGVRSIKSEVETTIEFVNQSQDTIKVYWLDLEGKRDLKHVLKPGDKQTQKTFLNHPWLVTDEQDNALGVYYPDFEKRVVAHAGAGAGGNPNVNPFAKNKGGKKGGTTLALNPKFNYLENAATLAELKLTEEQAGKVKALAAKQKEAAQTPGDSAALRARKTTELREEADKAIGDILNAAQNKRLDQILRQEKGASLFTDKTVVDALKLTDEQQGKFAAVQDQYTALAKKATVAGPPTSAAYAKQIGETRKTTFEAATALLTAEQKTAWQDVVGEPFQSFVYIPKTTTTKGGGKTKGGFPATPGGTATRTQPFAFNNWDAGNTRWLNEPTVQEALKLTDDQVKKIPTLPGKLDPKAMASDFLTPAQLKQYQGIYLQVSERSYGPAGFYRYKAVHDALNLSAEQKAKILTIGQEDAATAARIASAPPGEETIEKLNKTTEGRLNAVLTTEQHMRLRDLLGAPFRAAIQNPLGSGATGPIGKNGLNLP